MARKGVMLSARSQGVRKAQKGPGVPWWTQIRAWSMGWALAIPMWVPGRVTGWVLPLPHPIPVYPSPGTPRPARVALLTRTTAGPLRHAHMTILGDL